MGRKNDRHVTPSPGGGWTVRAPHSGRASVHAATQADAIKVARRIVQHQGGGELVIHSRSGEIRDKDTIPPAKDPFPPRG